MELRQLRYFVAVAQTQNFTRAAARLNIAQPPLSRQIMQLEEEIGVKLIERGSRPVRLTEAGRLFYDQAVQALDHIETMTEMTRRLAATGRPLLGIGFVASTLYGYLPEVIRRYRAARPEVEVSLLELTSLEQVAALRDRRIDVGFGRMPHGDPAVARVLMRNEPLLAAVPGSHPLAGRTDPLRLADLAGLPLVVYPKAPRPSFADQVIALFRARDVRIPALHEVRELQTALGLVAAESGIALVPASVATLRRDNVAYLALDEAEAWSPLIMSTRRDDASPEIALILKLVRQMYRDEGIAFGA
ncbi:MAG: LysR family transcriptional regulator [Amaricoccus sp.]